MIVIKLNRIKHEFHEFSQIIIIFEYFLNHKRLISSFKLDFLIGVICVNV